MPLSMDTVLYIIAAILIEAGLAAAIVPMLPGIPLIFGGLWLIAGVDQHRHIGQGWLLAIAFVGAVGVPVTSFVCI
jgi:uncharacterized protein